MTGPGRALTILVGIVTTILLGWLLYVGASILQPLVIALLLASMLQPVVRTLARFRIPPALTVIALVLLIFFGLFRLGILVDASVRAFVGSPPPVAVEDHTGETVEVAASALDWDHVVGRIVTRIQDSRLPEAVEAYVISSIRELDVKGLATDALGGGLDFVRGLFLVVLYMLFIFAEQAVFRRKILSVAGPHREEAAQLMDTIGRGIQRYLGVKTVASLLTGLICYVVLVKLQVPYALLFGFLTVMLNYIPTFGSIIAGILASATAFAVADLTAVSIVVVTYLGVNLTIGSYLEPKILGRELNLSPLVIIISVVVWAGIWGVVGTFLAVPLTSAIQIMLASTETTRPLAVLLSSGPPREERKIRARARRRRRAAG